MTGIGTPGRWQRAMLVATGIGVLGASLASPLAEAATIAPQAHQAVLWLQDDDQSQPSQVGEGDADTETLDQGSPPAASGDDVETLDQGPAPTAAGSAPVPVADGTVLTAAPVATDMAYTAPAGPQLPPGFGEGRVLVSNNPRGFPVGLEPCDVGVVSGRAYVGVNCGAGSGPVVGHSTYQDFPWVIDPGFPFEPGAAVVTDPSFPFDKDSPFFESTLDRTTDSDVVVLVAPRAFPFNDDVEGSASTDTPTVTTRGVVSMTQPIRAGKERNREQTRTTGNASSGNASSGDVSSEPGKSHTGRSASKKQKTKVRTESNRGKNSRAKNSKKSKANKQKKHKGANKETKKQRAKGEKHEKRSKDK